MKSEALDKLLARRSLDQFDAMHDMWIVVPEDALRDVSNQVAGFSTEAEVVRYARAMANGERRTANGNVDHRVLRVTGQVLVIATENEL